MKLINIGFGNMVASSRLIAIGRRTRAVLIMDSDHVVLSALQPETVAARFAGEEDGGVNEDA